MHSGLVLLVSVLFSLVHFSAWARGNTNIRSFDEAKRAAAKIHEAHSFTLYCNCPYRGKHVDIRRCGYRIQHDARRAARLEWEHVVPAEAFGQSFVEWREGAPSCIRKLRPFKGRKCARFNPDFSRMEADLYNLWPEIGELNGLRSNYSMAELGPGPKKFGACEVQIRDRKFEPMPQARGIVARVYLYMDQEYPGRGIISEKNRKLFQAWDETYPVSEWECERAKKIQMKQKNINSILQSRCNRQMSSL